ncbi:MAG: sodium:proton antiporter [Pirellulales bacterium]
MIQGHSTSAATNRKLAYAIILIIVAYGATAVAGLPQRGTQLIVTESNHSDEPHEVLEDGQPDSRVEPGEEQSPPEVGSASFDENGDHEVRKAISGEQSGGGPPRAAEFELGRHDLNSATTHEAIPPPLWTVLPFVVLLGAIALFPLFRLTERWWESNLHRFYVAAGLGLITLLYYAIFHRSAVEGHWPAHHLVEWPAETIFSWRVPLEVAANALLREYVPFIVLLFSLYTLSGGVRIEGDLPAKPFTNVMFIGVGGLLASFIGTTGAAMLLIRPLLETNRLRRYRVHTVVTFIFVVCNCGGCLLPIGDPPLFLGYLNGVPFFWTLTLWQPWLFVNSSLLLIYWAWDGLYYYKNESAADIRRDELEQRPLRISGLGLHLPLLIAVILSVATLDPSKAFLGTEWHPWMYLREVVQLGLVAISLLAGAHWVREHNHFSYHAILEVAALFVGIFLCMQPALQILNVHGGEMGLSTPMQFFLATGGLSSVLDNAPTYVVFFETAMTYGGDLNVRGGSLNSRLLVAISLGAVFMGAMTYIGNGPNFMVKAIAETAGVRMPSFFGYLKYSFGILLPVLLLTAWLFL